MSCRYELLTDFFRHQKTGLDVADRDFFFPPSADRLESADCDFSLSPRTKAFCQHMSIVDCDFSLTPGTKAFCQHMSIVDCDFLSSSQGDETGRRAGGVS